MSEETMLFKVVVMETRLYKVNCLVEAPDAVAAERLVEENGAVEYEEKDELVEVLDASVEDCELVEP